MADHNKLRTAGRVVLRLTMRGFFAWFGAAQLIEPSAWTSFVPGWLLSLGFSQPLLIAAGTIHIAHVVFLVGYNPIGVRDIVLAAAAAGGR